MVQLIPVLTGGQTIECSDSREFHFDEEALIQLSWNEIRERAHVFSSEWADVTSEKSEAKSFWDAFFNIFGISRATRMKSKS